MRLSDASAEILRVEIHRAGGREVCFLADVDSEGWIVRPRAVARGNHQAVLAAARDAPAGSILIHNHPSGVLQPSDADLAVAARIFDEGLGSALVDNDASRLYVVVEPPAPREIVPLESGTLEAVLSPGGALSRKFPGFEDRPGQREMLRTVVETYNQGGATLVEAGTGTGKSLAYLIPAAAWAAGNGERTVVSTATINLQEQLVGKDLPLVAELTGEPPSWALVKGRANYISIRRALLASGAQASLFEDDRSDEMGSIMAWMEATEDGSLADLSFSPSEEVWDEVKSDGDVCLRARCPHFQECFYQQSRRKAAAADILVVNHHLLFSDLSVRIASNNFTAAAVLPAYSRLVLDEAHNVEDAATDHLGVEVTRIGLFRTLARLDRRGRGLLSVVQDALLSRGEEGEAPRLTRMIEERIRPLLEDVRSQASLLMERLEPMAAETPGPVRLGSEKGIEPAESLAVKERLDGVLSGMGRLEREIRKLREAIEVQPELLESLEARTLDLQSVERRLASGAHALRLVLLPGRDEGGMVRWMETRGRGRRRNLSLAAAPLEPGPVLREALFDRTESTVLTSATLTTRGGFEFLRSRLGLEEDVERVSGTAEAGPPPSPGAREAPGSVRGMAAQERWEEDAVIDYGEESAAAPLRLREVVVPSPFDFQTQSLLVVPTDLGDPSTAAETHEEGTAAFVRGLAELTDGGIFVLFTSFRALHGVAQRLREDGSDRRWPLLVHGEAPRSRLLAEFVGSGRAILLGTASFWEGVDVPGDPLRGLVIQKLPFPVPTDPVTEARLEVLEARGRNSFWDYMLPMAALRLKQGFGRLIRSREDRGVVAILDSRILTRRYGTYLRSSLPDAPLVKGLAADVGRRMEDFVKAGD